MDRREFIAAWSKVAANIQAWLNRTLAPDQARAFEEVVRQSGIRNGWFTQAQVQTALQGIVYMLDEQRLTSWLARYPARTGSPAKVGVIMAGNIPMAGFHDLLCVLASGHAIQAKLSSSDNDLIPFLADQFFTYMPGLRHQFQVASKLTACDAVIATGGNNTSRYFEYYFGSKPHLFRKNRNSAAILYGYESESELLLLGSDLFTYFGLGCRNVSKLYVPSGYSFDSFFNNLVSFAWLMDHNKYMNNFDYHRALFLMNRKPFLTNNFLIVTEDEQLSSPVSVVHYEYYNGVSDLNRKLETVKDGLQCVVGRNGYVPFGQSQQPAVDDYADGVDTMEFLLGF